MSEQETTRTAGYTEGQILYRALVAGNHVWYEPHRVLKVTPKGGWIVNHFDYEVQLDHSFEWYREHRKGRIRWIPLDARFASPTTEEALARLRACTP